MFFVKSCRKLSMDHAKTYRVKYELWLGNSFLIWRIKIKNALNMSMNMEKDKVRGGRVGGGGSREGFWWRESIVELGPGQRIISWVNILISLLLLFIKWCQHYYKNLNWTFRKVVYLTMKTLILSNSRLQYIIDLCELISKPD